MTFVDPSRNPLHDPDAGLYHGDVPVDPNSPPVLRPADDPEAFAADRSSEMAASSYVPAIDAPEEDATDPADVEAYDDWTVEQLRGEARAREITGITGMNKADLVAALEADDSAE